MGIQSVWADRDAMQAGTQAQTLLAHAMACDPATAEVLSPDRIPGKLLFRQDKFTLTQLGFWFETSGGVRFSYVIGEAVRAEIPDPTLQDEFQLFLWGTVYGAVAWLNDLIPLHASAVSLGSRRESSGRAIAFTGASGAGKSTLAAGLTARGASQLCDDTLVLAPSADGLVALPDPKPLKLWEDSLSMLKIAGAGAISAVPGKHFAQPTKRSDKACLLTDLIFLEQGEALSLAPITGREKLVVLPEALYRGIIHIKRGDAVFHGQMMATIAQHVRFWTLGRPCNPDQFEAELAMIEDLLLEHC